MHVVGTGNERRWMSDRKLLWSCHEVLTMRATHTYAFLTEFERRGGELNSLWKNLTACRATIKSFYHEFPKYEHMFFYRDISRSLIDRDTDRVEP